MENNEVTEKAINTTKIVGSLSSTSLICIVLGFFFDSIWNVLNLQILNPFWWLSICLLLLYILLISMYELPQFFASIMGNHQKANEIISRHRVKMDHLLNNQQTRGIFYFSAGLVNWFVTISPGLILNFGLFLGMLSGVGHIYVFRKYDMSVVTRVVQDQEQGQEDNQLNFV